MIALVGHTAEYAPHGTRRSVPFCARAQTGIRRAGDRRSPRALECSPRFVEILLFGQVRRTVPSSGTMAKDPTANRALYVIAEGYRV